MARQAKAKKPFNLQSKLIAAIRKCWRYSPERQEAIVLSRDPNKPKHLICSQCKESIHEKLAAVDHCIPVVGVEGFVDWNTYINRMCHCGVDNLKILCEACHKVKSKEETKARAEYKKSLKPVKVKKAK